VKKHKPLSDEAIDKYFNYAVNQDAGTPVRKGVPLYLRASDISSQIWFIMIELVGGFSNKIPLESAAFAHRESFVSVKDCVFLILTSRMKLIFPTVQYVVQT
jgi:hypothetical protein